MSQNKMPQVLIAYEEMFTKLTLEALRNDPETFNLSVRLTAPEDVDKVGYGLFLRISDEVCVRAKYIYPTRAKALAKIADVLPLEVTAIAVTPYGEVNQGNGEP